MRVESVEAKRFEVFHESVKAKRFQVFYEGLKSQLGGQAS